MSVYSGESFAQALPKLFSDVLGSIPSHDVFGTAQDLHTAVHSTNKSTRLGTSFCLRKIKLKITD